jgi:hypothetical protein
MDQVSPNKKDFVELQQELLHEQLAAAWQLHIEQVEEQLRNGWQQHLARIVEERFTEFSARFDNEVRTSYERLVAEHERALATQERQRWSQQLSQIERRLDQAEDLAAWTAALLDGAAVIGSRVMLVSLTGDGQMPCAGARAMDETGEAGGPQLRVALEAAPAVKAAADSLDPVISLASTRELSPALFDALRLREGERVALLPVVTDRAAKQRKASAVLVVPGCEASCDLPALELLAGIAGLSLDVRQTATRAARLGVGQMLGIAPVRLDPVAGFLRNQGRRNHRTIHTEFRQLPVENITRWAGLVAGPQLLRGAKFLDQLADRFRAVGNDSQAAHLAIRLGYRHRYRFGMDIKTQKSYLFLHDRFLSACGSELCFGFDSQPNPRPAQGAGHSMMTKALFLRLGVEQSPPPLCRVCSGCCTVVLPVEIFSANGNVCLNCLSQHRGPPHIMNIYRGGWLSADSTSQ